MAAGTLCMAFYNVWSRPFIARSSPARLPHRLDGVRRRPASSLVAWQSGGLVAVATVSARSMDRGDRTSARSAARPHSFSGCWRCSLTTPTRVANTMTVNPIAASLLAAVLVGEPIGWNLVVGLVAVAGGIWLAASERRTKK